MERAWRLGLGFQELRSVGQVWAAASPHGPLWYLSLHQPPASPPPPGCPLPTGTWLWGPTHPRRWPSSSLNSTWLWVHPFLALAADRSPGSTSLCVSVKVGTVTSPVLSPGGYEFLRAA